MVKDNQVNIFVIPKKYLFRERSFSNFRRAAPRNILQPYPYHNKKREVKRKNGIHAGYYFNYKKNLIDVTGRVKIVETKYRSKARKLDRLYAS